MKKSVVLSLLLVCALLAGACSSGTKKIKGFVDYESEKYRIAFQHPEGWVGVDSEKLNDPALLEQFEGEFALLSDELAQMLSMTAAIFYVDDPSDGFYPSMNFVAADAGGLTQSALASEAALAQLETTVEQQYSVIFNGFHWVTAPQTETFGDNTFITYIAGYTINGMDVSIYQAITVNNKIMYTFSYSAPQAKMTDDAKGVYEQVLGSIEFAG